MDRGNLGRGSDVYPSVHFLHRQAARERHLALAQDYQKRAEQLRSGAA